MRTKLLFFISLLCFFCAFAQKGAAQVILNKDTVKTKAQQDAENWARFQKMVEDRVHHDWAWIKRYEDDNDRLPPPRAGEKRVVFLGNSITEGWINTDPDYFKLHGYIDRGIGGQTTPQMLVRFREDVINLHPAVVILLAGINDIAENTGPSRLRDVFGNIVSMAELAQANHIKVILSSVLPAKAFPWHPGIDPRPSVAGLNEMLKQYAAQHHLSFVNYYTAMAGEDQGMKPGISVDGVHPNLQGYKIMEPLAEAAIQQSLKNAANR